MAIILITGGTGLIGRALTKALLADGHVVRHLSRRPTDDKGVPAFAWDLARGYVDPAALHQVDHIVHLAGAGIADKRWTKQRVRELIDSRAGSSRLLWRVARESGNLPKSFISSAGIGYYGAIASAHVFNENDPPASDTIGRISLEWETGVDVWSSVCRVVKLRTPMVLAREGPLARLSAPTRWGLGAPIGSGRQWMPWVHIDDLVRVYQLAIADDRLRGAYNVNASDQPVNHDFMRGIAKALRKPFFLPAVPGFALKLALGELACILLEGSRADNERLLGTGFRFQQDTLEKALNDLLSDKR
ncbi:MAG: TIGR01777 family oxidoreductase [Flavobacteriales bacterium]